MLTGSHGVWLSVIDEVHVVKGAEVTGHELSYDVMVYIAEFSSSEKRELGSVSVTTGKSSCLLGHLSTTQNKEVKHGELSSRGMRTSKF